MADIKLICRDLVIRALNDLNRVKNPGTAEIDCAKILIETPPDPNMGDIGIPMFPFAKIFHMAPPVIAEKVVAAITVMPEAAAIGVFLSMGPYVNIKLDKSSAGAVVLNAICSQQEQFGTLIDGKSALNGRRVMIEFSSPNTNKPLHLGHLRNDALGESVFAQSVRPRTHFAAKIHQTCINPSWQMTFLYFR